MRKHTGSRDLKPGHRPHEPHQRTCARRCCALQLSVKPLAVCSLPRNPCPPTVLSASSGSPQHHHGHSAQHADPNVLHEALKEAEEVFGFANIPWDGLSHDVRRKRWRPDQLLAAAPCPALRKLYAAEQGSTAHIAAHLADWLI